MQSRDVLMQALTSLGATLRDRELAYHVVIIGGAALLLSNEGARPTEDLDVVAAGRDAGPLRTQWQLPDELRAAAGDVADLLGLDRDWLNAGAVAIVGDALPERYEQRLRHYEFGNLTVSVLARRDLLALSSCWHPSTRGRRVATSPTSARCGRRTRNCRRPSPGRQAADTPMIRSSPASRACWV